MIFKSSFQPNPFCDYMILLEISKQEVNQIQSFLFSTGILYRKTWWAVFRPLTFWHVLQFKLLMSPAGRGGFLHRTIQNNSSARSHHIARRTCWFAMHGPPPLADSGTRQGCGSSQLHIQQTVLRKSMPILLSYSFHLISQDNVTDPSCKALSGFNVTDCAVLRRPKNLTGRYSPMVETHAIPELAWVFVYSTSQTPFKICPCKHCINYVET